MPRQATIERKTKETNIKLTLTLDDYADSIIKAPIPFFPHMLNSFAKHGNIHLNLEAKGDIEVDYHHIVEDIGITLGKAFFKALGDKKNIARYGWAIIPMDESLSMVTVDLSNRPHLSYNIPSLYIHSKIGNFDSELIEEFFIAFAHNASLTLHINVFYGRNAHHIFESIFKAFGIALNQATSIDEITGSIKSTKGTL